MSLTIQPGLIYLTRAEWGARTDIPRLGYAVNRLDRTEAIIHHTVVVDQDATPNRWETIAEVKAKMVQLQTIRPDLGLDVPYNFVAFLMLDGTLVVCEGRGLDRTGAHTHAHNTVGIATALQGNFGWPVDLGPYIPALSRWWGWLKYDEGMENLGSVRPTDGPNAGAIAFGHIDLSSTACPGINLYAIIPQLEFKEDEMDDEEFNRRFAQAVKTVPFPRQAVGQPPTNAGISGDQTLAAWLEVLVQDDKSHSGDADKHSAAAHGHPHQHGEAG